MLPSRSPRRPYATFGSRLRSAVRLAGVGTLAALAACGDERPTAALADVAPHAPSLDKVVRLPANDAVLMVRTPSAARGERGGTSTAFSAVLVKKNGKVQSKDEQIDWTSLDERVATVTSDGVVIAQDTGLAVIVASYKDRAADSVTIVVIPVPVASIALTGADSIAIDDTTRIAAIANDSVGVPLLGRPVTWSSSHPAVAVVDTGGTVVALAPGTVGITAEIGEKEATHSIQVTLQPVATVTVLPDAVELPQYRRARISAVVRDRRGKPLSGRAVTWQSSDNTIVRVTAAGDTLVAVDLGSATATATSEGKTGSAAVTVGNPVEARALWVTRFEYSGATAVDFAKIAQIFQKAASANFNVVYFQVRTSGDALYFSDLEPCSPRMCGRLGGPRPAQDPLTVALAEAAKHGIQVHAWVNALTGFISGSTAACNQFVASTPANWLKAHPEWSVSTKSFATGTITRQVDNCATSAEYMYVSPGVPEVRAQLARVSADVARRYGPLGLRGIHLDRIRYPSNQVSYDPATQEAFRTATGAYPTSNAQASWLNARRGFVNQAVRDVHDSVRAVDPGMVLSAAVFPGYQPRTGWAAQWSFTDLFQDPQAWAQGGYLDVEVPMNYPASATSASWTVKAYCSNTDWTCVMDDHIARIERQAGRHVYVGVGAIRGWDEMKRQIDLAHDRAITGMSVYSFSQVDVIPNGWAQLRDGPFKNPATVPAMAWKQ